MNVQFSSRKTDWATPWTLFRQWDTLQGPFTLDVCATAENAKCGHFFSPKDDGLSQNWSGVCWLNPPYGRAISHWIAKAVVEVNTAGVRRVVCLLPARTDTLLFRMALCGFCGDGYASRARHIPHRFPVLLSSLITQAYNFCGTRAPTSRRLTAF